MSTDGSTRPSDATPGTDDGALLRLEGLEKYYDRSGGILDDLLGAPPKVRAVDGVDLTVREGETVAVVGESGCGKSTLGRAILNLDKPTGGTVEYRGTDITGIPDSEMRSYRRDLQMVFQDPLASLNPRQTVADILTAPMEVHDVLPESDPGVDVRATVETDGVSDARVDVSVADDVDRVVEPEDGVATVQVTVAQTSAGDVDVSVDEHLTATTDASGDAVDVDVTVEESTDELRLALAKRLLERVGLKASHVDRYPHQFSGGQQQRVAVARALSLEPELLVADEPVSALDVSVQAQLLNLFEDLQAEFGLSMLFISHDLSVVRQVADRVAVMYLGEIVEVAPVDELFENPQHPYTKSLLSAVPRIDPEHRTDRTILQGTVPSPAEPPSGCRFHTRCPAVVPPEDWTADQGTFRDAFTFRCRVLDEEIDPDAIRTRLETEGGDTTDEAVAEYIVDRVLDVAVDALPGDRADSVRETAALLAAGEQESAARVVADAFPSPCERETPVDTTVDEDHVAACHRVEREQ